ncbi:MAG: hypothetical protein ACR2MN_14660 [Acidimicrobiales bacterium]
MRIQPRSEYLHGIGPLAAVQALSGLAGRLCDDLTLSVNRLDHYADWQHWHLTTADKARFVGRADTARTYEQAGRLSGFDFGTRTSHTIVARIYDKTLDIDRKGADWWLKVWGDRHQPGTPSTGSSSSSPRSAQRVRPEHARRHAGGRGRPVGLCHRTVAHPPGTHH